VLAVVPLTYLFQALRLNTSAKSFTLRMLVPSGRLQWALALGVAIAAACRVALGLGWGKMWDDAGIALGTAKGNLVWLPLALFLIAKGTTLPLIWSAVMTLIRRNSGLLLVTTVASIPIVCAALLAYDLSRSLGYAFPTFFLALAYLVRHVEQRTMQRCLLAAALFNLAMPTYFIMAGTLYALLPIVRML
jgi:hypothetical protein